MQAWRDCKLGEVVNLKRGYDLPQSDRVPGPFPIVSSAGVTDHHSDFKVKAPGVVTGRYGTLGEVFFIEDDFWPLNTSLYVQDFKGNDPRFISYFLRQLNFGTQNAAGAVPGVNRNHLHAIDVRVPPLPEQTRIARILSAYDELIENSQRRVRILETMARALYREWFVHFRFPGHENVSRVPSALGKIPSGWEVKKLKDACRLTMGQSPKSEFYNETGEGQPFHQGVSDFGERFPTDRLFCTVDGRVAEQGDILFSVRAPVGRMNIADKKIVIGRGLSAIRHNAGQQAFLWEQLRNRFTEDDMMGNGAIFAAVTKDEMQGIDLICPPPGILEAAAAQLEPVHGELATLSKQIANLRRTRDLLLPRLLSGQAPGRHVEKSLSDRLPRVFELKDALSDPLHPDAYFQDFESCLKANQLKLETFQRLERLLGRLDDPGWRDLKARAAAQLQKKDPIRGWQTLFDTLGEAKGFVYLQKLGCTGVKFIPRPVKAKRMPKTHDLEAVQEGRTVLCEVKTINISQDEAQSRNRTFQGEGIAAEVSSRMGDPFLWKVRSKIDEAIEQLDAQDPRREARRIVFTVVHFDDWVGDYQAEYFEQIDEALLKTPVSGAELVFSPASNLFSPIPQMKSATVFEFE